MAAEDNSNKTVVRRVKASGADSGSTKATPTKRKSVAKTTSPATAKTTAAKSAKKPSPAKPAAKAKTSTKTKSKPFFLFRPIIGFGRYVRNSWYELRQVRWTNRRATWGLTLAVILFSAFFATFILFFDWVFNWLIKEVIL